MVVITRYQDLVEFRPDRFNAIIVAEDERVRVVLVCLEPGQFVPAHKPESDLAVVVLDGHGTILAGQREEPVGPGTVAFVPAGEARGLRAETRLVALHVVTPPPAAKDQAAAVKKAEHGIWR